MRPDGLNNEPIVIPEFCQGVVAASKNCQFSPWRSYLGQWYVGGCRVLKEKFGFVVPGDAAFVAQRLARHGTGQ